MGQIHKLIEQYGADQVRDWARSDVVEHIPDHLKGKVRVAKVAAEILAEESRAIGITYSGFALTALPHKKLPDGQPWERQGHNIRLLIEPGRLPSRNGFRSYGVPYGVAARLILLYLQTRALQTNNRCVELGRSMHDWLQRLDVSIGGKTYRLYREQCQRLSACNIMFVREDVMGTAWVKESLIQGGFTFAVTDPNQEQLWQDEVVISEQFFDELKKHPVPLLEPALRLISNNSMAIDIYIWLSYRLHSLDKPIKISWAALATQFSGGYDRLRDFRRRFSDALHLALAVYPDAKVEILDREGIRLHPSRPPIPKRQVAMLG